MNLISVLTKLILNIRFFLWSLTFFFHVLVSSQVPTRKINGYDFPYHKVVMVNGTPCDLLGNTPRMTNIIYMCNPKSSSEVHTKNAIDYLPCHWITIIRTSIVIYLDFHPAKPALWLVDSWSCAPDQIQMYPDQDTTDQLLCAHCTWSVHD